MFISSRDIKKIWFYLNLLFIANYSIAILRIFVRIRIPTLPNFLNVIILTIAYSITLIDAMKSPNKLISHPNTVCIALFLTFPHQVLLVPFYLLSIYHTNSFILSLKKIYEAYPFFGICVVLGQYSSTLGRMAMCFEVGNIPLSILMMAFGQTSIRTVFALMAVVRQQYVNNGTMRSVIGEIITVLDGAVSRMPDGMKGYYKQGKDFVGKYNIVAEAPKKKD